MAEKGKTNVQVDPCLGEKELVIPFQVPFILDRARFPLAKSDGYLYRHLKWYVEVEPSASPADKDKWLEVTLIGKGSKEMGYWENRFKWMVRVVSKSEEENNTLWESKPFSGFFEEDEFVVAKLMKLKDLTEKGLVHNGSVHFEVVVNADFTTTELCPLGKKRAELDTARAKPGSTLLSLMKSGEDCDVKLRAMDGKEVKAHRLILKAFSTEFSAMFRANMREKREGLVVIEDIGGAALAVLVEYIYISTQSCTSWRLPDLSEDSLKELVNAGEKYGIKELKELAAYDLVKKLTRENAYELLGFFMKFDLKQLVANVCGFVAANMGN